MRKYLFIFVLAALVLTACRAESNIIIDIEEDGSATISAEIGFDEEMLDLLSQTGDDPAELFTQDLPPEAEGFEPYSRADGDMTYYGVSKAVDDLENNAFLDLGQEFASDFASFSYTTDGSRATLDASIAAADVGGGLGDLPIDPTDITGDIFSANLIVSMPGTVVEHNADEVRSDDALVWNIPLTGTVDVTAVSDLGSGSSSWILWVLIGVLAVGIIAAVAATMMSRKESKNAVAAATAAYTASSGDETPALEAGEGSDTPDGEDEATDDASNDQDETIDDEAVPSDDHADDAEEPSSGEDTGKPDDMAEDSSMDDSDSDED
jgi:hypothetical protein